MTEKHHDPELLKTKVNLETAQIAWRELQRFFAAGRALHVARDLDLTDVAAQMADDNAGQIKRWMDEGRLDSVSDETAQRWYDDDALVWAAVIKPWVLVQAF